MRPIPMGLGLRSAVALKVDAANARGGNHVLSNHVVIGADPFRRPNPRLVVAVGRAGGLGVLDIVGAAQGRADLATVADRTDAPLVVRPRSMALLAGLTLPRQVVAVVPPIDELGDVGPVGGRELLVEVTSVAEADRARAAGAAGLVAVGCEAGGRVGDTEAFVLLQQLVGTGLPVWARGGIGLHTAAAATAAGAAGVVLDTQLALVRECPLDAATRNAIAAMDGSETRVVGGHRVFTRPDLPASQVPVDAPADEVAARLGPDVRTDLVPVGQDGAGASLLAERFVTAGGVVTAIRRSIDEHVAAARASRPLAPGRGVAGPHGTRFPVAQGPMTRVSDRAGFAGAVADGGGLPFLALALMRGPEVRALLDETAALLGDRPWGVGVLGFVPPELRDEQLREVEAVRPPFALIAGGRPSQAAALEAAGVRTYLHAPSPGLIDAFAKAGARRFVLEGRECGGHVGPRSSFVLWEAAVERLLAVPDANQLEVLFAGGIHDERSAAAVAALAAPLVERGARIGVLMGTAYLFTAEAVAQGAITPAFQRAATACDRTVLLETSPGHATRCADTPYVATFAATRARLEAAGASSQEMWAELEELNLGRLRIASKGLVRDGDRIHEVDGRHQREQGMFMLGQVAMLREEVLTVEALHQSVSQGATAHLAGNEVERRARAARQPGREAPPRLDVAIVGMAALMPGARDVEELWANILAGADAVTEVPPTRWDADRYYDPAGTGGQTPSKWGGFVPGLGFDALAYGIPPASLPAIDAVQLLALEIAARALADAGYASREFDRSRASVIFGTEAGTDLSAAYGLRALLPGILPDGRLPGAVDAFLPELTEDSFPGVLANVIAGRIANRLDLGGVNYTVDAACASSLAALDLACKELVEGTSDVVLCGGADLHNGINDYLLFASVHALSPQGRCRTFDAAADGIALGEGVACVVLKRLADAERDGDRIYAVVDAVAGSSDGRALGLTAPRADGQRVALERAYAQARRSPALVGLVEAHGTGTVVGDGTELATLTDLFTRHGAAPRSCVLGSVKSQIGHTKCAAGLAGVIKAARAVYHGVLPPTIGLDAPNPGYDEAKSPFRFAAGARPWAEDDRRAGVSAFGFGGTNFHTVLSSYPGDDPPHHGAAAWPAELFLIRAADAAGARDRLADLAALLDRIAEADPTGERHLLRTLARTVSESGEGPVQVALVADDLAHLRRQIDAPDAGVFERSGTPTGEVAFLFPGQGSQRVDMAADLFVAFPGLHRYLRAGAAWAPAVFPARAFSAATRDEQARALTDTRVAQPALGMVELALADLLGQVGVRPAAAAGHSYGELVALAVAGALDEGPLLALSAARGEAVHAAAAAADDPGTMAAVAAPEDDIAELLAKHPGVSVANRNAPRQTVVAGLTADIEVFEADVRESGVSTRRLPVACAFHSPIVATAAAAVAAEAERMPWRPPTIPVWSNTTAAPYPPGPAAVRQLVADQVARPVRFLDQIEAMYAAGHRVFVEVGPGRVLTGLVRDILGDQPHTVVPCDVSGEHGLRRFLLALAELAAAGVDVDPAVLFDGRAELADLAALPHPRPGWTIDGHLVRTVDGTPVAGGLQPATEQPTLALGAGGAAVPAGADPTDVVAAYLQNLRETVAAERDVMLRFLDAETGAPAARPVAAPAPPPPAAAQPTEAGPLGRDELQQALVDIVADRTGYPHDMLSPDLDLEADLSIDSIKRIEIIADVAERIGLPGAGSGGLNEAVVEELAQLKTLAAIVDWIAAYQGDPAPATTPSSTAGPEIPGRALRYVVDLVDAPTQPAGPAPLAGACVIVTDDGTGVADEVAVRIAAAGGSPAVLDLAAVLDGRELRPLVTAALAAADGVVHVALAHEGGAPTAFAFLGQAALHKARWLACVTAEGSTRGEAGFMRSLALEVPDRVVRSIAVDATATPDAIATVVVGELAQAGPVDVIHRGERRITRRAVATNRVPGGTDAGLPDGAVVLLTGGARGITARAAVAFAEAGAGHVELVGRTAPPEGDEPDDLAGAADLPALRAAVARRGGDRTPADVDATCRRALAEREIRATLAAVAAAGAEVHYHQADVRDGDALRAIVAEVHTRHGRIDGVVHGAGVIEDRLLRDKSPGSFARVYDTKALGARALLDAVPDDVGFVVLFGSVSGVFGNRGQLDYAAANDALDALAVTATSGRVLSIDWGPWGGSGMVSDELARSYARLGVGLIDPDDGIAALWEELAARRPDGTFADRQVVVVRARAEVLGAT